MQFPARSLVRFFANHHLLSVQRPAAMAHRHRRRAGICRRLTRSFANRIRTNCGRSRLSAAPMARCRFAIPRAALRTLRSGGAGLSWRRGAGASEGCRPGRTRGTVGLPLPEEPRRAASRPRQMPKRKRCWASWVYTSDGGDSDPAIFRHLLDEPAAGHPPRPSAVRQPQSPSEIPQDAVFDRHEFDHPVFDHAAIAAQPKLQACRARARLVLRRPSAPWLPRGRSRQRGRRRGALGASVPWRTAAPAAPFSEIRPVAAH